MRARRWVITVGLAATVVAGCAAPTDPRAQIRPHAVDEARLITLVGNIHPYADARHAVGPLDDGFVIEHLQLVLKRGQEQEATLTAHLDALHDQTSPRYHQWLTVNEFADLYGVPEADVGVVVRWLTSHGLRVDSVPPSRMFIEFSGTVAQLRAAFRTQVYALDVDGTRHLGNLSDPQIPEELAKVVVGIHALHDFKPHPLYRDLGLARRDGATGRWSPPSASPDFNVSSTTQAYNAVAPADFATIYNLNPLFAEGITGAGQTVVVVEDTNIKNVSDVATFRTAFGLSGYHGTFTQKTATGTTTCNNAGVNSAESEAALDAEWAGAVAPDAAIVLASCADTMTVYGFLIALQNLINGASPPAIVSMSYGVCESTNGAAGNASYVNAYQQAVALGVSVYVAAGDEGAASCDPGNVKAATHGIAVNGFASTPYNVAVGGTDFMDTYDSKSGGPALSTYWAASNGATYGSALSYIPEIPWNDTCASKLIYLMEGYTQGYGTTGFCSSATGRAGYLGTGAGSGGASTVSAQPTWQTGVVGLPTRSGGPRYLPDVSLFAADGAFNHFYVYCMSDNAQQGTVCNYTNSNDTLANAAGGTSFGSPAFAGIQALINQKMGGAQGNPNPTLYKLAAAEFGARGSARCNSSGGTVAAPILPDPGCIFHDVTQGDIDVPCTGNTNCFGYSKQGATIYYGALSPSSTTYSPAYPAGTGWDYATGLGSVNVYNLVTAWSK